MRCLKLLSSEAKRSSIAVAILSTVVQLLFVGSLMGGFHGALV
jgi:hypothetical protein